MSLQHPAFNLEDHIDAWFPDKNGTFLKNVNTFLTLLPKRLENLMIRSIGSNQGVLVLCLSSTNKGKIPLFAIEVQKENDAWKAIRSGIICHRNFPKTSSDKKDAAYLKERKNYQTKYAAQIRNLVADARQYNRDITLDEHAYLLNTLAFLPKAFETTAREMYIHVLKYIIDDLEHAIIHNSDKEIWWYQAHKLPIEHQHTFFQNVLMSMQQNEPVRNWETMWISLAAAYVVNNKDTIGTPKPWYFEEDTLSGTNKFLLDMSKTNNASIDDTTRQWTYISLMSTKEPSLSTTINTQYLSAYTEDVIQMMIDGIKGVYGYKKLNNSIYDILATSNYLSPPDIPHGVQLWLNHDRAWHKHRKDFYKLRDTLLNIQNDIQSISEIPLADFQILWPQYMREIHQLDSTIVPPLDTSLSIDFLNA